MRLRDKIAVITGTASGVGRAAAIRFAEEGAAILAGDVDQAGNEETVAEIVDRGGRGIACAVDVAEDSQVEAMIGQAESEFGGLHILFNNAGVMLAGDDDAVMTDQQTIDRTLEINVKGVLAGCRHGIPAIRRSGGGSIINTASFVATLGAATPQVAYTASKGAVLALSRELAVIHAKEGIRVNSISPGPLRTELLMAFLDTPEKRQRRLVHIPMGRFGEAREIAEAALFLASDEASFVTGTDLRVDGGLTAAYVTPE